MTVRTIETYVTVDVDLEEFCTEDLLEELESRGAGIAESRNFMEKLEEIWVLRRTGRSYERELDDYIYTVLGKIV